MQKIAIFYHVLQINNWVSIFEEQIVKLQQSGLYDAADYIHIGVNGNHDMPWEFVKVNKVQRNVNIHLEADTMVDMWKFCKKNPDYRVLYIHTKGVTHGNVPNVIAWRRYLEHFVIGKWKTCIEKLADYDCVGTEWEELTDIAGISTFDLPHYGGNFWWANAEYINKLDPNYLFEDMGWLRWQAEFWIGTANPNYFSFYSTNKVKYTYFIDPSEYSHI